MRITVISTRTHCLGCQPTLPAKGPCPASSASTIGAVVFCFTSMGLCKIEAVVPSWTRGINRPLSAVLSNTTRNPHPSAQWTVISHRTQQFAGKIWTVIVRAAGSLSDGIFGTIASNRARKTYSTSAVEAGLTFQYRREDGTVMCHCTRLGRRSAWTVITRNTCNTQCAIGTVVANLTRRGIGRCLTIPTTGTGQCFIGTDGAVLPRWFAGSENVVSRTEISTGAGGYVAGGFTVKPRWARLLETIPAGAVGSRITYVTFTYGCGNPGTSMRADAHRTRARR